MSQCTYDPRNTHFLVPQGQRPAGFFCPSDISGDGKQEIDFTVRLRAVGGSKTIASAMRLAGVSKSDVVDTVAIINKSWDFFKYAVDYLEDPMGKATSLSSPATTWHTMRRTYIPMWV